MLRTHCQTSGVSLTEQDPYNNVVRTTVEAMAAVLGGTQSLHTKRFDEALGLPTDSSARIARNTQLILAEETGIPKVVDPLGGSYYVEALTDTLADKAWALIEEVEALGGMTKAVESGMPKLRIEESAARRQARVDRGEEVMVGVNKYQLANPEQVDVLDIDNTEVRRQQIARSSGSGPSRDEAAGSAPPSTPDRGAAGKGNLLELCIDAAGSRDGGRDDRRDGARVRPAPGRDPLDPGRLRRRLRRRRRVRARSARRSRTSPRQRPAAHAGGQDGPGRARPGRQGHRHRLRRPGLRRRCRPPLPDPGRGAREAVENDVHVVGVSSQAGGHRTLVPQLIAELKEAGVGGRGGGVRRRHPPRRTTTPCARPAWPPSSGRAPTSRPPPARYSTCCAPPPRLRPDRHRVTHPATTCPPRLRRRAPPYARLLGQGQ